MISLAVDTETSLIAPGLLAPEMACLSWANDQLGSGLWHASNAAEIERLLSDVTRLVGANIAYDSAVIIAKYPHLMRTIFDLYRDHRIQDIQLNQMLIDIARGQLGGYRDHHGVYRQYYYSLDALHQRYQFGALDKNTWRLRYGEMIGTPLDQWEPGARAYPEDDAKATKRVDLAQKEWSEYLVNGPAQAEAAFALHLMSCRGLRTDPIACAKLEKRQKRLIEAAKRFAQKSGIVGKDEKKKMAPARGLMIKACNDNGLPIPLTDTGIKVSGQRTATAEEIRDRGLEKYVSTDAEACLASGDRTLYAFSIYGSAKTLLKKVETLSKGATIPLQTRFDVIKETGRTSSRAPGEPLIGDNFQNPPRAGGYRSCIIPRPGYVFCSVDYDGAELHSLAQVCIWALGHSRLAEVLNEGMDPHLLMAAERLLAEGPISYEQAKIRLKQKDPLIKSARQIAKVPNFGLPGGLGAATLIEYAKQYRVKLTLEKAYALIASWRQMWPEMVEYFAWIKAQLGDGLATIRQYISERVRGLIPYTVACNTYFQGLTADAAKSALLPLARECYLETDSALYGSYPVLFIHDEVLAELPEETAHVAGPRMAEIMVDRFNDFHPDCKVTAAPALMRRWHKDAEPVYVNGKLVPWEPRKQWSKAA